MSGVIERGRCNSTIGWNYNVVNFNGNLFSRTDFECRSHERLTIMAATIWNTPETLRRLIKSWPSSHFPVNFTFNPLSWLEPVVADCACFWWHFHEKILLNLRGVKEETIERVSLNFECLLILIHPGCLPAELRI